MLDASLFIAPQTPRLTPCGVGRVADNEKALILYFDRKPTDDEMRALAFALSNWE